MINGVFQTTPHDDIAPPKSNFDIAEASPIYALKRVCMVVEAMEIKFE